MKVILFVFVIFIVYAIFEINRPRPIDWSEQYRINGKSPYDLYVLKEALPFIFPYGKAETPTKTITQKIKELEYSKNNIFLFIEPYFDINSEELEELSSFVENGNHLFVAANWIKDSLLNICNIKLDYAYNLSKRSHINLPDYRSKVYEISSRSTLFKYDNSFKGEVLGFVNSVNDADFVRIKHGEGSILLNTKPLGFTNFYALDSLNYDYYSKALSFLPLNGNVFLLKSTTLDDSVKTSFNVLLQYPALKYAYYLILLIGLLYLLFKTKREQRAVPVIKAPENRSLEFVKTVSSLYYKKSNHYFIAIKRINYFFDEIRYYYKLPTENVDEQFIQLLSERAGVEKVKVEKVFNFIRSIRDNEHVDREDLTELIKYIELFKFNR